MIDSLGFSTYKIMSSAHKECLTSSLHRYTVYLFMNSGPLEDQKPLEYPRLLVAPFDSVLTRCGVILPLLRKRDFREGPIPC